jgi:hypothetical protein
MGKSVQFRAGLQLTALLGLLLLLAFRDPNDAGNYPTCPFRQMSGGLLCAGCGSMRMLYATLHGRLLAAFRFNPFGFAFLPLLGWLVIDLLTTVLSGHLLPRLRARPGIIWLLIVAILAYTLLRNVFPWLTNA